MATHIRHKRGTGTPGSGAFTSTAELLINTADGTVFTKKDNGSVVEVAGPAGIPQKSTSSNYTLIASDNGKHINFTSGTITVPPSVFSAGDAISLYNDSSSDRTIDDGSGVTMRLAGTSTTGQRTLAQRGLATLLCVGPDEFVISGAGLT
jgi:hypothetical protein